MRAQVIPAAAVTCDVPQKVVSAAAAASSSRFSPCPCTLHNFHFLLCLLLPLTDNLSLAVCPRDEVVVVVGPDRFLLGLA